MGLVLTPVVLWRLYDYAMSDIGAEPNPFPYPWWSFIAGTGFAFMLRVVSAFPVVLMYRLLARGWKKRHVA
jgi:hypothetical protein